MPEAPDNERIDEQRNGRLNGELNGEQNRELDEKFIGEVNGELREQLKEAIKVSLLTLLGITDKIEELTPLRESEPKEAPKPVNLLDPNYNRPWWPILAGLGGFYLGYRIWHKQSRE